MAVKDDRSRVAAGDGEGRDSVVVGRAVPVSSLALGPAGRQSIDNEVKRV